MLDHFQLMAFWQSWRRRRLASLRDARSFLMNVSGGVAALDPRLLAVNPSGSAGARGANRLGTVVEEGLLEVETRLEAQAVVRCATHSHPQNTATRPPARPVGALMRFPCSRFPG